MRSLLDTHVGDYDVMTPMVDIATLGAGGGSIAWLDEQGMFRVGPQSAGADPGPACYGKGGQLPTVTDALVVSGWYRPQHLAGAVPTLAPDKSGQAILEHVAKPLDLSIENAAMGIFDIAVNNMVEAMRVASVAKGFDPREFTLVAYGGAGGDGFQAEEVQLKLWAECRYAGQGKELAVETPPGDIDDRWADALRERFHAEHQRAYLRAYRDMPVRVINLGVSAYVPGTPLVSQESPDAGGAAVEPALTSPCLFPGAAEAQPTAFFRRSDLKSGHLIEGPAIIEQADTTTAIPPGWRASVDRYSNLHLTRL